MSSRRQELREYMERGILRDVVARNSPPLSEDAQDLLVTIVARYCEDRRHKLKPRKKQP